MGDYKHIQRTLLIPFGDFAKLVAIQTLEQIHQQTGNLGIIKLSAPQRGLANTTIDTLENILTQFSGELEISLRQISSLTHIANLNQLGFRLQRPDEIHLILIFDDIQLLSAQQMTIAIDFIRDHINRTLACYASFTGLNIVAHPTSNQISGLDYHSEQLLPSNSNQEASWIFNFDRGYFSLCPTNELGLVLEGEDRLIQIAAQFLTALVTTNLSLLIEETSIAPHLSFGIETLTWPGQKIAKILRNHLISERLQWLTTAVKLTNPPKNGQQFNVRQQLSPPLVLEHLKAYLPILPDYLLQLIPDPPYPWLLVDTLNNLTNNANHWHHNTLIARETISSELSNLVEAWYQTIEDWLLEQLKHPVAGVIDQIPKILDGITETLTTFEAGLTGKLVEINNELIQIETDLTQHAQELAVKIVKLPQTQFQAVLKWGTRPWLWGDYWEQCQTIQQDLRVYVFLLRAKLSLQQTVELYEMLSKVYANLQTSWADWSGIWIDKLKLIHKSTAKTEPLNWEEAVLACFAKEDNPWQLEMVRDFFQKLFPDLNHQHYWQSNQRLWQWINQNLSPIELLRWMTLELDTDLEPLTDLTIEDVLQITFTETDFTTWLEIFFKQNIPLFPYDETILDEHSRQYGALFHWLILPQGQESRIASLARKLEPTINVLPALNPNQMMAVTIRRLG